MANGKKRSVRQLRVGEQLRHVLAELFANGNFRDPDLAGKSITVCEVQVSADMRNATCTFYLLEDQKENWLLMHSVERLHFYAAIGSKVRLRYMLKLTFVNDNTFEYATEIDRLCLTQVSLGIWQGKCFWEDKNESAEPKR